MTKNKYNIISQTPVDDKSEVFMDYFIADPQEDADVVDLNGI